MIGGKQYSKGGSSVSSPGSYFLEKSYSKTLRGGKKRNPIKKPIKMPHLIEKLIKQDDKTLKATSHFDKMKHRSPMENDFAKVDNMPEVEPLLEPMIGKPSYEIDISGTILDNMRKRNSDKQPEVGKHTKKDIKDDFVVRILQQIRDYLIRR